MRSARRHQFWSNFKTSPKRREAHLIILLCTLRERDGELRAPSTMLGCAVHRARCAALSAMAATCRISEADAGFVRESRLDTRF